MSNRGIRKRTAAVATALVLTHTATGCSSIGDASSANVGPGETVVLPGEVHVAFLDSKETPHHAYHGSNLHERDQKNSCSFWYPKQGITLTLLPDTNGPTGALNFEVKADKTPDRGIKVEGISVTSNKSPGFQISKLSDDTFHLAIETQPTSSPGSGHMLINVSSSYTESPSVPLTTLLRFDWSMTNKMTNGTTNTEPKITIQSFEDDKPVSLQFKPDEQSRECVPAPITHTL